MPSVFPSIRVFSSESALQRWGLSQLEQKGNSEGKGLLPRELMLRKAPLRRGRGNCRCKGPGVRAAWERWGRGKSEAAFSGEWRERQAGLQHVRRVRRPLHAGTEPVWGCPPQRPLGAARAPTAGKAQPVPPPGRVEVSAGHRVPTARSLQPCPGRPPHVLGPLRLTPANALAKTVGKGPGEPPAPEITLR